jgi:flagellar hook-length control protein FliK
MLASATFSPTIGTASRSLDSVLNMSNFTSAGVDFTVALSASMDLASPTDQGDQTAVVNPLTVSTQIEIENSQNPKNQAPESVVTNAPKSLVNILTLHQPKVAVTARQINDNPDTPERPADCESDLKKDRNDTEISLQQILKLEPQPVQLPFNSTQSISAKPVDTIATINTPELIPALVILQKITLHLKDFRIKSVKSQMSEAKPLSRDANGVPTLPITIESSLFSVRLDQSDQPKTDALSQTQNLDEVVPAFVDRPVERMLKVEQDGQWLDQLTRDIVQTADTRGQLRFRLDPDHLGSLTIDVVQVVDGLSVRIMTQNDKAHTILSDAQPRLIADARLQGVRISESSVQQQNMSWGGRHQPAPRPHPMIITQPISAEMPLKMRHETDELYA